jgi:hypothetical protein
VLPPYVPYITTLGSSFATSVPQVELVPAMEVHDSPAFVVLVTLTPLQAVANAWVFRRREIEIIGISEEFVA